MNAVASTLLWMSVQVALFSLVGLVAFALVRRRGPTSAVACAATVLALTVPLALLVVSPWPRWQLASGKTTVVASNADKMAQMRSELNLPTETATADATNSESMMTVVANWWQAAVDWMKPAEGSASAENQSRPWQAWLPLVLAIGAGLGLVRLAVGVIAVRKFRLSSQPIADERLLVAVREISAKLAPPRASHPSPRPSPAGGEGEIQLRETSELRSAATIGWRRPVLLLPADWRTWSETELRAVLAHELAHAARHDYLTALVARFVTAIHFYQPLVLWLARQLRIEQELAADTQAAAVSGNRQTYLTALAQLALRADDKPLPWAARAFLPGTSMLIKRVAWLKRKGTPMEKSLSTRARWLLTTLMAAIALAVAGLRGPNDSRSTAVAQDQNRPEQPKAGGITIEMKGEGTIRVTGDGTISTMTLRGANVHSNRTFQFVPAAAKFVMAASPSELAKVPAAAMPIAAVEEAGFEKKFGLKFAEIADVQMIEIDGKPDFDRAVLRSVKPHDWKGWVIQRLVPLEAIKFGKGEYIVARGEARLGDFGPCYMFPDDRTLVAGTEEQIKLILGGGEKLMDPALFPEFTALQVAVWGDMDLVKQFMQIDRLQRGHVEVAALFQPLIDRTKTLRFGGSLAQGATANQNNVDLSLVLQCDSAEGAGQVAATLEAMRTFARNFLTAQQKANAETKTAIAGAPALLEAQIKMKLAIAEMCGFGLSTLDKARINSDGPAATVVAHVDIAPALTNAVLMPAVAASREAALRTQSINNMKQLALAMHMFASTHDNRFPAAAIRDQNGKPLLSWRVAILPFLEQEALFKEFHLNEPWDSEHNRKLIAKMPALFRDPHEDEKSTDASYFMVTGKGTIGGSEGGARMMDIRDGTMNTIMLVEAKRDIPWTKPEEIEIDADPTKPLPAFGGHMQTVFGAAFADGSIKGIGNGTDQGILRAMLTIAGGEVLPPPRGAN